MRTRAVNKRARTIRVAHLLRVLLERGPEGHGQREIFAPRRDHAPVEPNAVYGRDDLEFTITRAVNTHGALDVDVMLTDGRAHRHDRRRRTLRLELPRRREGGQRRGHLLRDHRTRNASADTARGGQVDHRCGQRRDPPELLLGTDVPGRQPDLSASASLPRVSPRVGHSLTGREVRFTECALIPPRGVPSWTAPTNARTWPTRTRNCDRLGLQRHGFEPKNSLLFDALTLRPRDLLLACSGQL